MAIDPVSEAVPSPIGSPPDTRRSAWAVLAPLMALAAVSHFNRISMAIAGDERIMAQYGLAPERMGWIYSAFLIAYMLGMIPGGWVIDRIGAKAALTVVGLGSAAFVALTGGVGLVFDDGGSAFGALLVIRGLMGVVSAPLHPSCARVVGERVAVEGRSRANGLITGAALLGIAATPPAFGALIARLGWPAAFLIASAVTAGLAVTWHLVAEDRRPPSEPGPRTIGPGADPGWGALLRDRSLVLLTLSYAAVGYFQYLFFYWMNYYFQRVLALPKSTGEFYAAIPPLAMALGMPLGGWISDALERSMGASRGRRVVPMAGLGLGAALLGVGVLAREPAWIVTWLALALAAVGAAEGPFWATAVERGERRGGRSAALMNTGGNAGGLLAPVVTPWVGQRFGWPPAMALGSLVCLVGVALWLGIDPGRRAGERRD